jgi:hypothetical protein
MTELIERLNNLKIIEEKDDLKIIEEKDDLKIIEENDNSKIIEEKDNLIKNKGTGAGGKNTNKNGKSFENITDIETKLIENKYEKMKMDKSKYGYYLYKNIIIQGSSKGEALNNIFAYLHKEKIDSPSTKELRRYINRVYTEYEYSLFNSIEKTLTLKNKQQLNNIIETQSDGNSVLALLKSNVGKISTPTIKEEVKKLEYIKNTGRFTKILMETIPRKILKRYQDKLSIVKISDLVRIRKANPLQYYGMLGCFCLYKGAKLFDILIEIFIRRFHKKFLVEVFT